MDYKMKKRIMKFAFILMFGMVILYEPALLANAATDTTAVTNTTTVTNKFKILTDIVTAIISSLGMIITLWGISEWGMAFQGNEGSMQAHAFKRVAGGLIMILSPQILKLLV